MKLRVGDKLPIVVGDTQHGSKIDTSEFIGQMNLVLYFYPKDNTPGCSLEAQEFNRLLPNFEKLDTQIIGVSVNTLVSHSNFSGKYGLAFPLIADFDKRISGQIGVLKPHGGSTERTTFVINKKGIIKKIYRNVKPAGHAQEVLTWLENNLK